MLTQVKMRGSQIVIIACLALLGSPVSGVNLVSNGDFSDSAEVTGWAVGFGNMTWWPFDAPATPIRAR